MSYLSSCVFIRHRTIPITAPPKKTKKPLSNLRTKTFISAVPPKLTAKPPTLDTLTRIRTFYGLQPRRPLLTHSRFPAALTSPFTSTLAATIPPPAALFEPLLCATNS